MINHGKVDCRIQEGDRIAQLIIEKMNTSDIIEVDELEFTERVDRGFASTDMSPKTYNNSHRCPTYDMLSTSRLQKKLIL